MSEDLFEQVSLPPPVEGPSDELVDRERAALLGSIDAYPAQAAIPNPEDQSPRTHRRRLRRISYVVLAAALIAAIAIVLPGHRTPLVRFTTRWELAKPLRMHLLEGAPRAGSWQLVGFTTRVGWQQNTEGPEFGYLTCASAMTCFVTGDGATNPSGPSDYNSIYLSQDFGRSWSVLPLPDGTSFSAALSCVNAEDCFAGAFVNGDPAFLSTSDGGHRWTVEPIPAPMQPLVWLACSSATACDGVTAPAVAAQSSWLQSAYGREVFVSTADGGLRWTSRPFARADAITAISCPHATDCVAVGYDIRKSSARVSGLVLRTEDGGASWSSGTLPAGFGFNEEGGTDISCGDTSHCMAIGYVNIPNPHECGSPAATEVVNGTSGCSPGPQIGVSGIVTTADGGTTWKEEAIPADVPDPMLSSVSCASADDCWVSGSEAVYVLIGTAHDGGSAVLLGTADGGERWVRVTFSVPAGAPNFQGQSYQDIGAVSCPRVTGCMAIGDAAQGSTTAPIYSYVASRS